MQQIVMLMTRIERLDSGTFHEPGSILATAIACDFSASGVKTDACSNYNFLVLCQTANNVDFITDRNFVTQTDHSMTDSSRVR